MIAQTMRRPSSQPYIRTSTDQDFETYSSDLLGMKLDILEHIQHLEKWSAGTTPDAGFLFGTLGRARVR